MRPWCYDLILRLLLNISQSLFAQCHRMLVCAHNPGNISQASVLVVTAAYKASLVMDFVLLHFIIFGVWSYVYVNKFPCSSSVTCILCLLT